MTSLDTLALDLAPPPGGEILHQTDRATIIWGDCRDPALIAQVPDWYGLLCTDPPYGVRYNSGRSDTFTQIPGDGAGRAELDRVVHAVKRMGAGDHVDPAMFSDERTALVLEPLRWAIGDFEARFNTIVLEQVPQVLPVWQAYAEVLSDHGYSVATGILRTEQYDVPQTRRRAVLVARLDGPVALPEPSRRPYRRGIPQDAGDGRLEPWLSMGDVLPHRGEFTVISNYGTGGDARNRGRRTSHEPAFTVTGKISRLRLIDPDGRELPRLTPAEAGLLQGFPADWPWAGNDIAQQIGNACPPPLAAALMDAATRQSVQVAA